MPKPRVFVKNDGRWPAEILYSAATPNAMVWITTKGMIVDLRAQDADGKMMSSNVRYDVVGSVGSHAVTAFASKDAPTVSVLTAKQNCSALETATTVVVRDVLAGIDLEYVWDGDDVRYNIHADAGVTPPSPFFSVKGARDVTTSAGGVTSTTALGQVTMSGIVSYQKNVFDTRATSWTTEQNTIGFSVADRDMSSELTIDPVVRVLSIHGNADEGISVVKRRSDGTYVIGGWTTSIVFTDVAPGVIPPITANGEDGFIAVLSADLKSVLRWTYVSGSGNERVRDVSINAAGLISAVGETNSANFPVKGSTIGQLRSGGKDGFVVVMSSDLTNQVVGILIAGNADDVSYGVAFNTDAQLVVVGSTASASGLAVAQGYCDTLTGETDGFMFVLNPTFQNLDNFTYFGGTGFDSFQKIVIDQTSNSAVIVGTTTSQDVYTWPRKTTVLLGNDDYGNPIYGETGRNAYNYTNNGGNSDVFVVKFTPSGDLYFASYFGGNGTDVPAGLFIDTESAIFIAGSTTSSDIPIPGSTSRYSGRTDGFVAALTADGLSLRGASYIGGTNDDYIYAVTQFQPTIGMIVGRSESTDFPALGIGSSASTGKAANSFLANMTVTEIKYSTLMEMEGDVTPSSLVTDQYKDAIFSGRVVAVAGSPTVAGPADAVVAKWAFGTLAYRSPTPTTSLCAGKPVTVRWIVEGIDINEPNSVDFSTDNGETWVEVGTNIKAREYTYTIPASMPASSQAKFRIRALRGHQASTLATLTVGAAPNITSQPVGASPCPDATVTLTVVAIGPGCTYQWRKNDQAIIGATFPTYVIPSVQTPNNGNYTVVVTNACLAVTSAIAQVAVTDRPVFTSQPSSKTATEGETVVLSVVATGSDLTYTWQKDGSDLQHADADKPTVTLMNVAKSDAGSYTCVVTSACGNATSDAATLVVNGASGVDDYNATDNGTLALQPQPSTDVVMVIVPPIASSAVLVIRSLQGTEVMRSVVQPSAEQQIVNISTTTFSAGTYSIQLISASKSYNNMLQVVR